MRVSVLGGTGLLGTRVVQLLDHDGIESISASRSAEGPNTARFDFETGEGLESAIEGCDTVILLSSNPRKVKEVDIAGTKRLLPMLGQKHLVFISIVGVDRHPLSFYQAKYEIEGMITASSTQHTIVRATQFHDLVGFIFSKLVKSPVCLVPRGFKFQPVDVGEVAQQLVDIARSGPGGLLPDLAGPEVLGAEHLARTYMEAVGKERPVIQVPIPGRVARAFRDGVNTNPDRAVGRSTWAQYLDTLRATQYPDY